MLRLFLIFSEIEPRDYYIDNIELHFVKSQEENISFFKVNVKLKLDPFLHMHIISILDMLNNTTRVGM